ncbi:MAG: rhodanese-like domain-containing protein [Erysipelotrichia bacterium]|jgi:rhodanese-related sulfurtransferase|nr:rhodanese-like domain-containing protein [Erysipelotrichia bacterium]
MFNFGSRQRISASQAYENLKTNKDIIVLDVRTKQEFKGDGHIKNAINISVDLLQHNVLNTLKDKDATIYVVCYSGSRSAMAVSILKNLGYTNVYDLGGMAGWPYEVVYA